LLAFKIELCGSVVFAMCLEVSCDDSRKCLLEVLNTLLIMKASCRSRYSWRLPSVFAVPWYHQAIGLTTKKICY